MHEAQGAVMLNTRLDIVLHVSFFVDHTQRKQTRNRTLESDGKENKIGQK